jgi:hypothetical protein
MHFFFVQAYRGLKSCTSLLENVSLRVPTRLGTSQPLALVPQINTVLLLGAPMLPTWWVKILIYLQSERFLFVIFYNFVLKLLIIFKALVPNPYVHVLCSF